MKKKQLIRFLFFALLLLGVGCTEVDVKYPPGAPDTESLVIITPSPAMPAGTKYYFYPATGAEPAVFSAPEDGSLNSKLPFGTYRLLAVNAEAGGVEFKNMSRAETACAYLKSGEEPADVYVLSIDEVVVEEGDTATYSGAPKLLTHTMTLNLDLSAIPETVTGVSGSLNGFYPGVSLVNGEPVVDNAATTTIDFANNVVATRANSETYPVNIRSFGLLNPATEGNTYNSTLELHITTASGSYPLSVDLTAVLAGGLDESGNLPSGTELPVEVENPIPPAPSNPTGGAEEWGEGDDRDGELKP